MTPLAFLVLKLGYLLIVTTALITQHRKIIVFREEGFLLLKFEKIFRMQNQFLFFFNKFGRAVVIYALREKIKEKEFAFQDYRLSAHVSTRH